MNAISTRTPATPIAIQYDCRGKRETKQFDDAIKARHFYGMKLNNGKQPVVAAGKLDVDAPAPASEPDPATETTTAVVKKVKAHASPKVVAVPEPQARMTRPGACGAVLRKFGLDCKVSDEMVAEVDKLYGVGNERETRFALANARNSIKGFLAAQGKSK